MKALRPRSDFIITYAGKVNYPIYKEVEYTYMKLKSITKDEIHNLPSPDPNTIYLVLDEGEIDIDFEGKYIKVAKMKSDIDYTNLKHKKKDILYIIKNGMLSNLFKGEYHAPYLKTIGYTDEDIEYLNEHGVFWTADLNDNHSGETQLQQWTYTERELFYNIRDGVYRLPTGPDDLNHTVDGVATHYPIFARYRQIMVSPKLDCTGIVNTYNFFHHYELADLLTLIYLYNLQDVERMDCNAQYTPHSRNSKTVVLKDISDRCTYLGYIGTYASIILGLDTWDTSNVTEAIDLFRYFQGEEISNIKDWNTSKIRILDRFACECAGLKVLDISNWNLDSVESTVQSFHYSRELSLIKMHNCNYNTVSTVCSMLNDWITQGDGSTQRYTIEVTSATQIPTEYHPNITFMIREVTP